MKSRMTIASMLIVGVLTSGTGTGLAVSGVSDSGSASQAQYPPATPTERAGTAGDPAAGDNARGDNVLGQQEAGDHGVAGARESGGQGGVQATRQASVQEESGSLPFTGLAAIPLILIGLALLAGGVLLRRRLPDVA